MRSRKQILREGKSRMRAAQKDKAPRERFRGKHGGGAGAGIQEIYYSESLGHFIEGHSIILDFPNYVHYL